MSCRIYFSIHRFRNEFGMTLLEQGPPCTGHFTANYTARRHRKPTPQTNTATTPQAVNASNTASNTANYIATTPHTTPQANTANHTTSCTANQHRKPTLQAAPQATPRPHRKTSPHRKSHRKQHRKPHAASRHHTANKKSGRPKQSAAIYFFFRSQS